jgi:hypothetical protein
MRTFNFAATIRRVFAIRINAAAIVTGKRSSHKPCRWHARHCYQTWQAVLRFAMRVVGVRRDGDLMPLGMSFSRLQPCSVASQRQGLLTQRVGPVERS